MQAPQDFQAGSPNDNAQYKAKLQIDIYNFPMILDQDLLSGPLSCRQLQHYDSHTRHLIKWLTHQFVVYKSDRNHIPYSQIDSVIRLTLSDRLPISLFLTAAGLETIKSCLGLLNNQTLRWDFELYLTEGLAYIREVLTMEAIYPRIFQVLSGTIDPKILIMVYQTLFVAVVEYDDMRYIEPFLELNTYRSEYIEGCLPIGINFFTYLQGHNSNFRTLVAHPPADSNDHNFLDDLHDQPPIFHQLADHYPHLFELCIRVAVTSDRVELFLLYLQRFNQDLTIKLRDQILAAGAFEIFKLYVSNPLFNFNDELLKVLLTSPNSHRFLKYYAKHYHIGYYTYDDLVRLRLTSLYLEDPTDLYYLFDEQILPEILSKCDIDLWYDQPELTALTSCYQCEPNPQLLNCLPILLEKIFQAPSPQFQSLLSLIRFFNMLWVKECHGLNLTPQTYIRVRSRILDLFENWTQEPIWFINCLQTSVINEVYPKYLFHLTILESTIIDSASGSYIHRLPASNMHRDLVAGGGYSDPVDTIVDNVAHPGYPVQLAPNHPHVIYDTNVIFIFEVEWINL